MKFKYLNSKEKLRRLRWMDHKAGLSSDLLRRAYFTLESALENCKNEEAAKQIKQSRKYIQRLILEKKEGL